jgi:hypothetical protein
MMTREKVFERNRGTAHRRNSNVALLAPVRLAGALDISVAKLLQKAGL